MNIRSPLPLLGVPEIGLVIMKLENSGKYRQLLLLRRRQYLLLRAYNILRHYFLFLFLCRSIHTSLYHRPYVSIQAHPRRWCAR